MEVKCVCVLSLCCTVQMCLSLVISNFVKKNFQIFFLSLLCIALIIHSYCGEFVMYCFNYI